MRPLIAGNWKMNGSIASGTNLVSGILEQRAEHDPGCDILVCPPFVSLRPIADLIQNSPIMLGGQDCHTDKGGAHTGDISASMLRDVGCQFVIVGHSERRVNHKEENHAVLLKAKAAHDNGLIAIICLGETHGERKESKTLTVIKHQLEGSIPETASFNDTVIAYEPVWAIGTGLTPSNEEIKEVHDFIRDELKNHFKDSTEFRLLYGGSVNPDNAQAIFSINNVNGGLVGGASLKAEEFWKICKSL